MAEESNPAGENPVVTAEPPVADRKPATPTIAADFVATDTDRPRADESNDSILPPAEAAAPAEKPKRGAPRKDNPSAEALRSRARYARQQAERAAPPSFADLPGAKAKPGESPAPPPIPGAAPVDYKANAEAMFVLCAGAATMLLGPDWQPQNQAEKEQVVNVLAKYMEYKKWTDLSPGWALTVILAFYAMPRFSAPETKRRIGIALDKLGVKKKPAQQEEI